MLLNGRVKRTSIVLLFPKLENGFNSCKDYFQRLRRRLAQIRNFDKNAIHLHPYEPGEKVLVNVKVITRGGVGKLLRARRGPYTVRHGPMAHPGQRYDPH